eukprot:365542-Chlamydomonas_euryale.AAC.27
MFDTISSAARRQYPTCLRACACLLGRQVIQLTTDLLKDAQQAHAASEAANSVGAASSSGATASSAIAGPPQSSLPPPSSQIVTPPLLALPSILPASVAEQIRKAQVRAAVLGQADPAWAIGHGVMAKYSADGQFYNATVEAVTTDGKFVVSFEGYTDKEAVSGTFEAHQISQDMPCARCVGLEDIKPQAEVVEVYQGVAAPKRKRVEEQPVVNEMPKWLVINEEDDEKTKARKKKLIKSYKSKMRFQDMDLKTKQKADSWQSFMSGKGAKKKKGFFTGTKKESIFKVPDSIEGKVGVVGSGRGLTDYQKQGKHQFDASED